MNRTFTVVSLQAALATAILTVAPLAGATTAVPIGNEAHAPQLAPFVSQLSREQVRAEAAVAARQVDYSHTDQQLEPQAAAAESTLTRAQVHAGAVQANRNGLTFTSEYQVVVRAGQGSRVASQTLAAAR